MATRGAYPRVGLGSTMADTRLQITSATGDVRVYDSQPSLREGAIRELADKEFFPRAQPDLHGCAVIRSDAADPAESELWVVKESVADRRRFGTFTEVRRLLDEPGCLTGINSRCLCQACM